MSTKRNWAEANRLARQYLKELTPEENAAITAAAESDPDNPPLTDADFAQMRPLTDRELEVIRRARGQRGPGKRPPKSQVTLRIDPDVLEVFKAGGPGWQRRINDALRDAVKLKRRA